MSPAVDDLLAQARKAAATTKAQQDASRAQAAAAAADRARQASSPTANTPQTPATTQAG